MHVRSMIDYYWLNWVDKTWNRARSRMQKLTVKYLIWFDLNSVGETEEKRRDENEKKENEGVYISKASGGS